MAVAECTPDSPSVLPAWDRGRPVGFSGLTPGSRLSLLAAGITLLLLAWPWAAGGAALAGSFLMVLVHGHYLYSYLFSGRAHLHVGPAVRIAWLGAFAAGCFAWYWVAFRVLEPAVGGSLTVMAFMLHHIYDEVRIRHEEDHGRPPATLSRGEWGTVLFYATGLSWLWLDARTGIDGTALEGSGLLVILRGVAPFLFVLSLLLHLRFPPHSGRRFLGRVAAGLFAMGILLVVAGLLPFVSVPAVAILVIAYHGILWYAFSFRRLRRLVARRGAPPSSENPLERVRTEPLSFLVSVLGINLVGIFLWMFFQGGGVLPATGGYFFDLRMIALWTIPHFVLGFLPKPARLAVYLGRSA